MASRNERPLQSNGLNNDATGIPDGGESKRRPSWFTVAAYIAVTALASAIAYLLFMVLRHRSLVKKRVTGSVNRLRSLGRATPAEMAEGAHDNNNFFINRREAGLPISFRELREGDLIFTRQRSLSHQGARLSSNLKGVAIGFFASLPFPDNLPSHVALVISPPGQASPDTVEILDINSKKNAPCVTSLTQYKQMYDSKFFDVHVAPLNRRIHPSVIANLRTLLEHVKPEYGTSIIFKSMLPRTVNQFFTRDANLSAMQNQSIYTIPVFNDNEVRGLQLQEQMHSTLFELPHYSSDWNGIATKRHTCSSLIYAAFELAGFVASFKRQPHHRRSLKVGYKPLLIDAMESSSTKEDSNSQRILEPFSIVPADFIAQDFQWTGDVTIKSYFPIERLFEDFV